VCDHVVVRLQRKSTKPDARRVSMRQRARQDAPGWNDRRYRSREQRLRTNRLMAAEHGDSKKYRTEQPAELQHGLAEHPAHSVP